MTIIDIDKAIYDMVQKSYADDKLFGSVIQNPKQYPAYTTKDGLIYHQNRLCIPSNDRETCETLLKAYHDDQNHFGIPKTQAAISQDYLWPGITSDVKKNIHSCDSCACNKPPTQAPAGLLHPMPIPENRFSEIAIDFVRPFPTFHGYDIIWVITDRLTNYVKIEPLKSTATALEIANLFYRTWYK